MNLNNKEKIKLTVIQLLEGEGGRVRGKKQENQNEHRPHDLLRVGLGLDTVRLTGMAIRLMVENGTAKPLTIHQAIFWECLQLQDGCVMAEDGRKHCTDFF